MQNMLTKIRKTIAVVLQESREYIERHGWWKGALRGPNGKQVCSAGAIIYSQQWQHKSLSDNIDPQYHAEYQAVMSKLLAVINTPAFSHGHQWSSVESWNDDERTAKQQVLDVFAKAEKIELNNGIDPDAA